MDSDKSIEIDIKKICKGIKKSYKLVILLVLIFLLLGIFADIFFVKQNNEYEATSSIYSVMYGSIADSTTGLHAMIQYSDIVKSYKVAERAEMMLTDPTITKDDIYTMISTSSEDSLTGSSSKIYIKAVTDDGDKAIRCATMYSAQKSKCSSL